MGKKRAPLQLGQRQWQALVGGEPSALEALLQEPGRATDLVRAIAIALQPGGTLNTADAGLRLQVLGLLEQRAVELCGDAPTDLLRQLYEVVRDRAAAAPRDAPPTAARLQLAALHTLTQLLVKLDMPQRDARLVKVHVEMLFRVMERGGPHAAAAPDLCRAAATCLRVMEEGAPTLLLAGSKQLLELARRETSAAAESYATLAARVLAHGAARCLDGQSGSGEESGRPEEHAEQAAAAAGVRACCQAGAPAMSAVAEEEQEPSAFSVLSSIDVRALVLGGGSGSDSGCATPAGARDISPHGTLDAAHEAMTAFASGRTATSSEDLSSPKEVPGSPRGVASLLGTASTCDDSGRSSALSAVRDAAARAPLSRHASIASSEISGSVQLDSGAVQPLLSPASPGLRHYRVPQHLHWPDALGQDAVCVCLAPEALPDLRQACLEFLAALPLLSVEGVACVTAALPPIMRLAQLPAEQLQAELDGLLHSGRTLMLQAVLRLYSEVPEGFGEWQCRLVDSVLMMVNGPTPTEHRVVAATWCLVQHHAQMHGRQPSLFAGNWRQLLPRPDDPPQLLSLKVKALSACLAVGIGRPEEICPMLFAWDGFWQRAPSDQQQRLATYALRMLGSAAVSYGAAPPAQAAAARRGASLPRASGVVAKPAPTPHYVKACLVSACLQLLATRPQYLPAVEAFLANCGSCCPDIHLTLLNAVDALLSAAATGTFASLQPRPGGAAPHRLRGSPGGGGSPRGSQRSTFAGMLQRVAKTVSKKLSPGGSPDEPGSLQQQAEGPARAPRELPAAAEASPYRLASPYCLAAPQPPCTLQSWEEAEAWLWDSRTWAALSANMLAHDPMAYRSLLLRLAQSGGAVLPMGTLRLLAAYATQYQGEQPGHELPAKEAGNCVLAICQAAAMTHLLIGPAGAAPASARKQAAAALAGRGRTPTRAGEEASVHSVHSVQQPRGASPGTASADGTATPQWTVQQEEVAAAMQAVLAALTSHSPAESVRRRAQGFLDLLANPCAWDLRLRMGTMAKMLGGYFSDAVSMANYL